MLHNARVEYQQEAHEIATYTVIDSLATAAGDKQTAKLARDILRQEVRMQEFLAGLLPKLSVDVAHDEIPVSEINGPAARVTAGGAKGREGLRGDRETGAGRSKTSSRTSRSSSRSKAKA